MTRLKKTVTIHAPVDRVYALARDPHRWNTWMTSLGDLRRVEGKGGRGTVVEHDYRLAGIPFAVTSTVLEDQLEARNARWHGKFEGPLRGEHTWTYNTRPAGDETEVTVDLELSVPDEALRRFEDPMLVERLQERALEHTLGNLKLLCEAVPVLA